jgi:hypothetical protein
VTIFHQNAKQAGTKASPTAAHQDEVGILFAGGAGDALGNTMVNTQHRSGGALNS